MAEQGLDTLSCLPVPLSRVCVCVCVCGGCWWSGAVACQAPLSKGFSRQEHWSGLPCPPPGDLPNPGIESTSPTSPALAGGFFTTSATWEAPVTSLHS